MKVASYTGGKDTTYSIKRTLPGIDKNLCEVCHFYLEAIIKVEKTLYWAVA
jgi:hypothetical protein